MNTRRKSSAPEVGTSKSTKSKSATPTSNADAEPATIKPSLPSLITFQGQLPARELFAFECREEIRDEVARIQGDEPELPSGAPLWQKAVKNLFTDDRKAEYEGKIEQLRQDHGL